MKTAAADKAEFFWETGLDLDKRVLLLLGDVDEKMAATALKAIHLLNQRRTPFTIKLSSGGGSVFDGMAIYDAIRQSPCVVTIIGCGHVQSMASLIFQAADNRILESGALLMLHDGAFGEGALESKALERWAIWSRLNREWMYGVLEGRTKKSRTYWEKTCVSDAIYTAAQAVSAGLADSVA